MRRRAKRDDNHSDVVKWFRQYGATVHDTAGVGDGFPDIVVGYKGRNILVEIKDGDKPPSARKLTLPEAEFHDRWRGEVVVVENFEDVFEVLFGRKPFGS